MCWCGCGSVGGTPHRPASKSACRTRRREEFSEEIVIFRQFFLMVVQLHAAWALTLTELFRPALGHCHRRNCRAHGSLAARITAVCVELPTWRRVTESFLAQSSGGLCSTCFRACAEHAQGLGWGPLGTWGWWALGSDAGHVCLRYLLLLSVTHEPLGGECVWL